MEREAIEAIEVIEARPSTPPRRPAPPSEAQIRRELDDAIDRRRAADTRAKAAKVTAFNGENAYLYPAIG